MFAVHVLILMSKQMMGRERSTYTLHCPYMYNVHSPATQITLSIGNIFDVHIRWVNKLHEVCIDWSEIFILFSEHLLQNENKHQIMNEATH